jgi:alpha-L-rhamnosidase
MRETYLADHIMPKDRHGDWCMPPESPELIHSKDPSRKTEAAVLGTTCYYRMLFLLERFANLLNNPADAKAFADEAVVVKKRLQRKIFQQRNGSILQQHCNRQPAVALLRHGSRRICRQGIPKHCRQNRKGI